MRAMTYAVLIIMSIGTALAACAPVQFSQSPNQSAASAGVQSCNGASQGCTSGAGLNNFNYTIQAPSVLADILFVVDNSASMYVIQSDIGNKFTNFISSLGEMNYQIGFTTTDIGGSTSPYVNAGVAPVQNGTLAPLSSGSTVIVPSTPNAQAVFDSGIERPETRLCDQNLNNQNLIPVYCPNQDTQGIAAANLAIEGGAAALLRPTAPLSVIIISNSDEAACAGQQGCPYVAGALDQPGSLRQTLTTMYSSTKSLNVNAIIIRPGDASCYASQKINQNVFGWYGFTYAEIAASTGNAPGSVCASDYGSQLSNIASSISNAPVDLPCAPVSGTFQISLSPADPTANPQLSGSQVTFAHALAPNTQIHLVFSCTAN